MLFLLGLLLDFFIVLTTNQYLGHRVRQQLAVNQRLRQEIAVLNGQMADIGKIKEAMARLIMRAKMVHQLMSERLLLLHVFDELAGLDPQGVTLHALQRHEGRILLEGEALSNSRLSLLLHHLEKQRWLHNPLISDIQNRRAEPALIVNHFKLSFSL